MADEGKHSTDQLSPSVIQDMRGSCEADAEGMIGHAKLILHVSTSERSLALEIGGVDLLPGLAFSTLNAFGIRSRRRPMFLELAPLNAPKRLDRSFPSPRLPFLHALISANK